MLLVKLDYKGKYYMLQDEDLGLDIFDYIIGYINSEDVDNDFAYNHADTCMYYGIPPYIGKDKELIKKFKEASQRIEDLYEEAGTVDPDNTKY